MEALVSLSVLVGAALAERGACVAVVVGRSERVEREVEVLSEEEEEVCWAPLEVEDWVGPEADEPEPEPEPEPEDVSLGFM